MIDSMTAMAEAMAHPHLMAGPALLALLVLGPLAWGLASVVDGHRWTAVAAAAYLSAAVAITLARPGLGTRGLNWHQFPSACTVTDPRPLTPEGLLNLTLLVPFALLAVLAVGHPLSVAASAVLVSAGIEAAQVALSVGTCDSSDLVRNSAGALAAALLAAVIRAVAGRGRADPVRPVERRHPEPSLLQHR